MTKNVFNKLNILMMVKVKIMSILLEHVDSFKRTKKYLCNKMQNNHVLIIILILIMIVYVLINILDKLFGFKIQLFLKENVCF